MVKAQGGFLPLESCRTRRADRRSEAAMDEREENDSRERDEIRERERERAEREMR